MNRHWSWHLRFACGSVTLPGNTGTGSGSFWSQVRSRRGRAEGQEGQVAGPRPRRWQPRPGRSPDSGLAAPASPPGLRPRSPYPQDVVALCAAARDLDALRGAHGGGRSVRPGRLSAAPPRALPAPRLRVALGTWHLQPPEPGRTARREIVARQPRPLRRRRQRPLTGAGGKDPRARRWRRGRNLSRRAGRRKCGSERDAALRGPGVDKTHLGAFLSSRKGTWLQRPLVARGKRERE